MSATLHHFRAGPTDIEPANLVDELYAERARIGDALARYGVVDERLARAAAKIAEIDQALVELDRNDLEKTQRWAETAEDEPPPLALDERKALLSRRLDAEAERQAAQVAVDAVAAKRTALIHQMNGIGLKFRERKVTAALVEARRLHAETASLVSEVGARLMRLEGLRQALIQEQAAAVNQRNEALAGLIGSAVYEVEGLRAPDIHADKAVVDAHIAAWRKEIR